MDTKFLKTTSRGILMLTLLSMLVGSHPGGAFQVLAAPGDVTRVSVDSGGVEANGGSTKSAISGDGRFVAFQSGASNLVSGDTNNVDDIFVRDRQTGATTRVSARSNGAQANGGSSSPAISSDGRFVAFYSDASNLLNGDTNGFGDIFVHDRQTGQTTRVSVNSSGAEANAPPSHDYAVVSISGDGRFVAFYSDARNLVSGDTNNETDIFVHDRQTGRTVRASVASDGAQANAGSGYPNLSGDGRYVTFESGATNLVAGDTNNKRDVFVRDLQTGTTTRVSVNSKGDQADGGGFSPDISGDGRYVVFLSDSSNLDLRAYEASGEHAYLHDRQGGQTLLVSVYSTGDDLGIGSIDTPAVSRDGRYVAFEFREHGSPNQNTYVYDLLTGASIPVTQSGDGDSWPSLSANGNLVAFVSPISWLVSGDTNGQADVFVSELSYGPERNPTVVSVTPDCGVYACPHPTPADVNFIATFSEQVTGVTADDFFLNMLDGVSGASITGVSGYGSQYFVSVNTGTGDGRLRLDLVDNDSIVDSALNPLGGPGAGNGNKSGASYNIDKSVPMVTGITRADPSPTAADAVRFTVNFSEGVGPVRLEDFALTTTGSITGASVTAISPREDEFTGAATYTVTVSTGAGDGSLRLDLIDNDTIGDWDGPLPLGGAGTGNGNFSSGEIYTILKSTPIVPTVTSSLRVDPNPTAAGMVSFSVAFSEAVSGVDPGDFTLTTTGSVSGALVANVSGAGNAYTVIVATGGGDGGLRLDVLDNDSILNASSVPLGGPGAGNGNFNTGEAYTLDKTFPIVTGSLRADPNPTSANSVNFTVVFAEAVSGVDPSDFFLSTTGAISGAAIIDISGSGYLYTISVSTGNGDGTLRLDILDNDSLLDAAGQPLGGSGLGNGNFTTGEEYMINKTPVNKTTETLRSNGVNDGWVLESGENSNKGGSRNANGTVFVIGDNAKDQQFRAILDFPTYYLPDNAVITRVLLMIKKEGLVGNDPFMTHQNILVDMHFGAFGNLGLFPNRGLQTSDFQNPSSMDAVGVIQNNPLDGWYWAWIDSTAFQFIDLNGFTQFRLRFQTDDNDNRRSDHLRFYSGDHKELADRPRLVVEYSTR